MLGDTGAPTSQGHRWPAYDFLASFRGRGARIGGQPARRLVSQAIVGGCCAWWPGCWCRFCWPKGSSVSWVQPCPATTRRSSPRPHRTPMSGRTSRTARVGSARRSSPPMCGSTRTGCAGPRFRMRSRPVPSGFSWSETHSRSVRRWTKTREFVSKLERVPAASARPVAKSPRLSPVETMNAGVDGLDTVDAPAWVDRGRQVTRRSRGLDVLHGRRSGRNSTDQGRRARHVGTRPRTAALQRARHQFRAWRTISVLFSHVSSSRVIARARVPTAPLTSSSRRCSRSERTR